VNVFSLMYHDVVHANARSGFDGADADSYKLAPDEFARHVAAISRAVAAPGRARTPREVSWRKPSQPPAVLLHFDDGGACALDVADQLELAGWRGYFHITTDRIGTPGFVTPLDLRELHARGHVIGSHSCSHPRRMSSLSRDAIEYEWVASKQKLEDLVGDAIKVAAIPNGTYAHSIVMAADRAGFEILFTSEPTSACDWVLGCLVLGRYAIRRTTTAEKAARLATGAPLPRWEQWAVWNTKKVVKRVVNR
jgi:peptidoglycan/xylan/chitin deacetylase (PgdA/CDA1 family)